MLDPSGSHDDPHKGFGVAVGFGVLVDAIVFVGGICVFVGVFIGVFVARTVGVLVACGVGVLVEGGVGNSEQLVLLQRSGFCTHAVNMQVLALGWFAGAQL